MSQDAEISITPPAPITSSAAIAPPAPITPSAAAKRMRNHRERRRLGLRSVTVHASVRAELAKNAPPIDYAASYDSLDVLEKVMRRFYLRGLIEEKMGVETDWKAADSAFVQAVTIAEKVAKYRHAQLSAVRLAGDLNATVTDDASLDELMDPRHLGKHFLLAAPRRHRGAAAGPQR